MSRKHIVEDQHVASLPRKSYQLALVNSTNVAQYSLVDLGAITEKSIARLIS
jgi:hypothetical protein